VNATLHIGEVARRLAVTPHHLRTLETRGRIPPARRDDLGSRVYDESDIEFLRALGIGSRPTRLRPLDQVVEAR
jgi:DNA-binding transcriptional MerR regulator